MSIRKRIFSGLAANTMAQGITVFIQIFSLPIFLQYWTAEKYGVWLMLSAIPSYFSLADVGLVSAAMNQMTILAAKNKHDESNKVFQSALFLTVFMVISIALISTVIIGSIKLEILSNLDNRISLLLLVYCTLINIFNGLFDAVFRANNHYAKGTLILNVFRFIEWTGGIIGFLIAKSFVMTAIGYLVARIFSNLLMLIFCKKSYPQYIWRMNLLHQSESRRIIMPAISFMAFPIGNAISIQGITLIVGHLFGPAFLAVFTTYRTLTRVLVQIITMISRVLSPEFSRLYGEGNFFVIKRLYRIGTSIGFLFSTILSIAIYFSAPEILKIWTHGKIVFDSSLLKILLFTTALTALWQISMVILTSTNQHGRLSVYFLFGSIFSVILISPLEPYVGTNSAAWSLLLFEIFLLLISVSQCKKLFSSEEKKYDV